MAGDLEEDIQLLEIQKQIADSKNWDDKIHLEKNYQMHLNTFDNVVRYLCNSVGIFRTKEIDERGFFGVKNQNGEQINFDISKDYNKTRGENKLVSYVEFNTKTKSRALLHYSPTRGIGFEYASNLLPKNVQLGKEDFFGKHMEDIIKNVESATEDIKFDVNVERFSKAPNGLKYFYISTKDFVKSEEKQRDVISIISTLDSLMKGLYANSFWISGENFKHEKEGPLFNLGIKININDWATGEAI